MLKSRKFTPEEREELVNEMLSSWESNDDILEELGPFKKPRDRSKNLIQKLTNYNIVVERAVRWASRQTYLELLKSFLAKEIGGITFRSEFLAFRTQNMIKTDEICKKIEEGIKPIPDFYYISKSEDFCSAIDNIFFAVDQFDPHLEDSDWNEIVYSESKLRSVIQESYLPILQKSCDLDDSFFQSKIDLNRLVERSYTIVCSVILAASGFLLSNFI